MWLHDIYIGATMSDYNLTIFDLKEGKEYQLDNFTIGRRFRVSGGRLEYSVTSSGNWRLWDDPVHCHKEVFREVKPKKKLYAYLVQCTNPDIYTMEWYSGVCAAVTCIRMPDFDREIES